jgi:hypothetical protein
MPTCTKCNDKFPNILEIDGRIRHLNNRKYCLKCSPFNKHNTQKLHDLDSNPERTCKYCGKNYIYTGKLNKAGHRKSVCNSCKTQMYHRSRKLKCVIYKGGKCIKCGYNKSIDALCFHHTDPNDKYKEVSKLYNRSWALLKNELDKCCLLCLNCHAEAHSSHEGIQ